MFWIKGGRVSLLKRLKYLRVRRIFSQSCHNSLVPRLQKEPTLLTIWWHCPNYILEKQCPCSLAASFKCSLQGLSTHMNCCRFYTSQDTSVSKQAIKNLSKSTGWVWGTSKRPYGSVFWFTVICLSTCYNKMNFSSELDDISLSFQSIGACNSCQVQVKVKYYPQPKMGCMAGSI